MVDEQTAEYPNALVLVRLTYVLTSVFLRHSQLTPAITNSNAGLEEYAARLRRLLPWALNTSARCPSQRAHYDRILYLRIEDGIKKLRDGPYDYYIPDLKWDVMQDKMVFTPLLTNITSSGTVKKDKAGDTALPTAIVRKLLDISVDNFLHEVPLTGDILPCTEMEPERDCRARGSSSTIRRVSVCDHRGSCTEAAADLTSRPEQGFL
jgi:hypothetical protein